VSRDGHPVVTASSAYDINRNAGGSKRVAVSGGQFGKAGLIGLGCRGPGKTKRTVTIHRWIIPFHLKHHVCSRDFRAGERGQVRKAAPTDESIAVGQALSIPLERARHGGRWSVGPDVRGDFVGLVERILVNRRGGAGSKR